MTYRIRLRASARRALSETLPPGVAAAIVEFLFGPLADNPYRVGKPLVAQYDGYYGARRGEYRIIYEIGEAEVVVTVVKIDHRRDVYHS